MHLHVFMNVFSYMVRVEPALFPWWLLAVLLYRNMHCCENPHCNCGYFTT
jgi:hypothetical protein